MGPIESIMALAGTAIGAGGLGFIFNRRGTTATAKTQEAIAETTVSDSALKLIDSLTARISGLEALIDSLRKEYSSNLEALRKEYMTAMDGLRKENLELHKEVAGLRAELRLYKKDGV